jgi:hypothetical protein
MKRTIKMFVSGLTLAVMGVAVPVASFAAINFHRQAGLGDLFTLDQLFSQAPSSAGILDTNKTTLGNLMILDQLFPVQTAAATTQSLASQLSGKILLQVQDKGQAWYVNPANQKRYSLGSPSNAIMVMSQLAVGVTNATFDSYGGVAPSSLAGKFIIKPEDHGKLYYVVPTTRNIIYINGAAGAANIMNTYGVGITNANLTKIPVAS